MSDEDQEICRRGALLLVARLSEKPGNPRENSRTRTPVGKSQRCLLGSVSSLYELSRNSFDN